MDWPESNPCPSPLDDPKGYRQQSDQSASPTAKTCRNQADHSRSFQRLFIQSCQFTPITPPRHVDGAASLTGSPEITPVSAARRIILDLYGGIFQHDADRPTAFALHPTE